MLHNIRPQHTCPAHFSTSWNGSRTVPRSLPRRSFRSCSGRARTCARRLSLRGDGPDGHRRQAATALKPTQRPSAFVQVASNGEVTVTINRLEFGQGVNTALPMVLGRGLDADWAWYAAGTNDASYADPLFGIHLTGGSHYDPEQLPPEYRELGDGLGPCCSAPRRRAVGQRRQPARTQAGTVLGLATARWVMASWPKLPWRCPCRRQLR